MPLVRLFNQLNQLTYFDQFNYWIQFSYSNSSDSCDSSFIDNSELDDDAYYFDDQDNIHIFTKYLRHFDEGNILEVEKELNDMKYYLRKPRITLDNISTYNIYVIFQYNVMQSNNS